ncbi:MAG: IPT/TIG domain-containing protein [Candidatus Cyclobacteriaceae bacterium M2_1C_046]
MLGLASCGDDDEPGIPITEIPTISAVTPDEGTVGTELSITGTNFIEGAIVEVGGIASNQVEVSSPTQIFALVPSGIAANTALGVTVRNTSLGEATLPAAFTAIDPVLSFINSATKPSGIIGSTVILEGNAFGDIQGNGKVLFADGAGGTVEATIANEDDWTNDFIVTTVPTGAGDGPVVVETEIGTSNAIDFMIASAATFSPSIINWTLTTSLPVAVSGHNAVFANIDDEAGVTNNFVYVTGGNNSAGLNTDSVFYGMINADGTISAWNDATVLPDSTAYHSSVVATPFNSKVDGSGYLYVFGGTNTAGEAVNSVARTSINQDGSLNAWEAQNTLPEPLHSLGAVIFRSTVYIAGGATTGDVPVAKVYKSEIDTTGTLGEWQELTSLPAGIAHHGFVTFGGYLYVVGGDAGTVSPSASTTTTSVADVLFAKINLRTGDLTNDGWAVNPNTMQKARSKHVSLVAGGNLFVSSGLYAGQAGSSENIYAQIFSDGIVDAFAGATGSNNLNDLGPNLYNTAGVSYTDASGVPRVMIIGGNSLDNPGTKTANVIYY